MVFILSEANDQSTNDVIDWVNDFKCDYFRVNETDKVRFKTLAIREKTGFEALLQIEKAGGKSMDIQLSDIKTYWYRRGNFNIDFKPIRDRQYSNVAWFVNKYLYGERAKLISFLHHHLLSVPHINSYFDNDINKLHVMSIASRIGLKIPETAVVSSRRDLNRFEDRKIVTKALSEGGFQIGGRVGVGAYTGLVSRAKRRAINNCQIS